MNIHHKINELRQKIGKIEKNSRNPFYNSRYASIDYIEQLINENLPEKLNYFYKVENEAVSAGFVYHGEKGQEIVQSSIPLMIEKVASVVAPKTKDSQLEIIKIDPQKVGSAITYYKRYCLVLALGLTPEDEDDDGNSLVPAPRQLKFVGKPKSEIIKLLSASQSIEVLAENWKVLMPDIRELNVKDLAEVMAAKNEIKQLIKLSNGVEQDGK